MEPTETCEFCPAPLDAQRTWRLSSAGRGAHEDCLERAGKTRRTMAETIEGMVARTNDKGFMLEGREGWLNYSIKAEPPPPKVSAGQCVKVTFTQSESGGCFANQIEFLQAEGGDDRVDPYSPEAKPGTWIWKDRMIMRQSLLKTATEAAVASAVHQPEQAPMLLSGEAIKARAAQLEEWCTRNGEAPPEDEGS